MTSVSISSFMIILSINSMSVSTDTSAAPKMHNANQIQHFFFSSTAHSNTGARTH